MIKVDIITTPRTYRPINKHIIRLKNTCPTIKRCHVKYMREMENLVMYGNRNIL